MKKSLLLLGILSLSVSASYAYLTENQTADPDVLGAQGYSTSMQRSMDVVNESNKGIHSDYQRRYVPKSRNKLGNAYSYLKLYFDPYQEDDRYGRHEVNFTNTWMGDNTHYVSNLKRRESAESL